MRKFYKNLAWQSLAVALATYSISFAFASDAQKSKPAVATKSVKSINSPNEVACPIILKRLVAEDLQQNFFGDFQKIEESAQCSYDTDFYADILTERKMGKTFSSPRTLAQLLEKRYNTKVNPSYSKILSSCNSLSPKEAFASQVKFYATADNMEKVNSIIIDELAQIDRILPDSSKFSPPIECTPIWPDLKQKCERAKQLNASCFNSKEERFAELVARTQKAIPIIESLITAQHQCLLKIQKKELRKKIDTTPCDSIHKAIELQKNKIPWIRGEEFQKISVKKKTQPRNSKFNTEYDLSQQTIVKAISAQLNLNRKTLSNDYSENLDHFRCLVETEKLPASCDYEKIKMHLARYSKLKKKSNQHSNAKDLEDLEINRLFNADKCLSLVGTQIKKSEDEMKSLALGITLTAATIVGGEIIAGVRILDSLGSAARIQQGLVVGNFAANTAIASHEIKNAIASCQEESQSVIALAIQISDSNSSIETTSGSANQNICSKFQTAFEQAKELESDCLTNSLLTAPSVLPILATIPALRPFLVTKAKPSVKTAPVIPITQPKLKEVSLIPPNSEIKSLGEMKLSLNVGTEKLSTEYKLAQANIQKLTEIIRSSVANPEKKRLAMQALEKFLKENLTETSLSEDTIGLAWEYLYKIDRDHNLSDEIRKLGYAELNRLETIAEKKFNHRRLATDDPYQSTADVKKQNTVSFLDDTPIWELSDEKQEHVGEIGFLFPELDDPQKRRIFDSLVATGKVPDDYAALAEVRRIQNRNNLEQLFSTQDHRQQKMLIASMMRSGDLPRGQLALDDLARLGIERKSTPAGGPGAVVFTNKKNNAKVFTVEDSSHVYSEEEIQEILNALADGSTYKTSAYKALIRSRFRKL